MCLMSRRRFIALAIAQTSLLGIAGCGTVLHPERKGQPAGPLDWEIVALDAIGLLLFFVPGVIAFAVDFHNGTIYLPPSQSGQKAAEGDGPPLVSVRVPDEPLTVKKLEEVVSQHVDQPVLLTPGGYQTEELKDIHEFWPTAEKHREKWEPA